MSLKTLKFSPFLVQFNHRLIMYIRHFINHLFKHKALILMKIIISNMSYLVPMEIMLVDQAELFLPTRVVIITCHLLTPQEALKVIFLQIIFIIMKRLIQDKVSEPLETLNSTIMKTANKNREILNHLHST